MNPEHTINQTFKAAGVKLAYCAILAQKCSALCNSQKAKGMLYFLTQLAYLKTICLHLGLTLITEKAN